MDQLLLLHFALERAPVLMGEKNNTTVEESNTWVIIFMCIGIIFTIFFCTFTILDEIKKKG